VPAKHATAESAESDRYLAARPTEAAVPPHGVLPGYYREQHEREDFVRTLFDDTAPDYNRISRLLSFGSDRWYRRKVLERVEVGAETRMLDLATGTGLVVEAALAAGCLPEKIVGLDPSPGMLAAHGSQGRIRLVRGRGEALPFRNEQFDLVTMGYAVRHVADLGSLFCECHRVLRPDGQIAVMEISRPRSPLFRFLIRSYFRIMVPMLLGWQRRARAGELLAYYWDTIESCVPSGVIVAALAHAGFAQVSARRVGPALTDYEARKPRTR